MTNTNATPEISRLICTIRFVRGYRFLDRCGQALIKLEDVLDEGWLPDDVNPQAGGIRNYQLGMSVTVCSEYVQINQDEYIHFDKFLDQACKIYDVFRATFEIQRITAPTLATFFQVGFENISESEQYIRSINLMQPSRKALDFLRGEESARSFVICTEHSTTWEGLAVNQRRRLEIKSVRQERQPPFDKRIMMRLPLLQPRQRDAIQGILELRRRHVSTPPVAALLSLENSFESELDARAFPVPQFLTVSWQWASRLKDLLHEQTKPT